MSFDVIALVNIKKIAYVLFQICLFIQKTAQEIGNMLQYANTNSAYDPRFRKIRIPGRESHPVESLGYIYFKAL